MATLTTRNDFAAAILLANANTAIDAYIDAIYAAANVSYTPGAIVLVLDMTVAATDDATSQNHIFRMTVRASAYDTLKTNLDELFAEIEDAVTDCGDFDLITTITGVTRLTLTYT